MKFSYRFLLVAVTLAAFATSINAQNAQKKSGIDPNGFDRSVRVQDDLFEHVNGTWLKNTKIPEDKSNYGSFIKLADDTQARIRKIIEKAAQGKHEKGSNAQKVGDFYKSFINEELANQKGVQPLEIELSKIRKLKSKGDLIAHFGYLQRLGVGTPIGFFVRTDDKNSTQYLTSLIQSGTTLPDKSYYSGDDESFTKAREALKTMANSYLKSASSPSADGAGNLILELESRMAEVQWERVKLRDANARYNKFKIDDLVKLTPNIDWKVFFQQAGVEDIKEVNVMTPSFFEGLDKIISDTPVETWKTYLEFQLIDSYAELLSQEFVDAHFELHSKTLAGIKTQKPRAKRAVEALAGRGAGSFGILGDVVGKLYVDEYFKPAAKARMDELVKNLLAAYKLSIDELTWMTDDTKKRAQEKLSKITTKIGYPEKWRDYSKLEVDAGDLVGNAMRGGSVSYQRMIDKLGKPVDRTEWGMTPHTVNAYYNPSMNEIVFPAAILQAPFFSMSADDSVNYGGIGAVIGHEISHAFDDQGSRYDGDGNLKNWWTDKDRSAFKDLTNKLVDQYAAYSPLPDKNVNGKLTLGENIADLSGLSIAFKAYKISLDGKKSPDIAGWTGEQRFFLGWSQVWQRKYREAEMVRRLLRDPHSPSRYRANGPVMNLDAFYEAFNVKKGDKLFKPKEERIKIW